MILKVMRTPTGLSALFLCLTAPLTYVLLVRSQTPQPAPAPTASRRIETKHFRFSIPADMKERPVHGIDLSVWKYSNEKITLDVQYGLYPDDLKSYSEQPDYQQAAIKINGFEAIQVTFRLDESLAAHFSGLGRHVAAVHFPNLANGYGTQVTMWANCASAAEQQVAKDIFSTIEFTKTDK
jgi:hypothetical protein